MSMSNVDEMLARQHMAGRRLSWYRVEYLRELYFPLHDWYICDTDALVYVLFTNG